MATPKLVLIDGLAALYRSYFAIRELSTADGTPTNAVFGFVRLVRQIEESLKPSHWAAVFDGGIPERRTELVEAYKAQRPPMPDKLKAQLPIVEEFLACRGVPMLRVLGEEADDVMATLVRRFSGEAAVVMATSDKDMYQLVSPGVTILHLGDKGEMGMAEVVQKTGVSPAQVRQWLSLVGDASDNIPGVPGVGAKTAAALLTQFGSLEEMWKRLHEVRSPRIREVLAANRAVVERNLRVVALREDVDCALSWDELAVRRPDADRLLAFFERLEFGSMARELREPRLL